MEYQGRNFMFCNICGTMLKIESAEEARCPCCNHARKLRDNLLGQSISYSVTSEEIKRDLGLTKLSEEKVELSKIKRKCEKCGHDEASYYTRQMRSADEGQTTFYTCVKCLHQFQDN